MTSPPLNCWGAVVDWPAHSDVDVCGSPFHSWSSDGDRDDPKRVLCDRLVRGEMTAG